jgi:hypothetical protein
MAGEGPPGGSNGTAGAGGASAGGGGGKKTGGPSANPALFKHRTELNEAAVIYYAAAIAGLMGVFILFHLIRVVAQKTRLVSKTGCICAPFLYVSRLVDYLLYVKGVPQRPGPSSPQNRVTRLIQRKTS